MEAKLLEALLEEKPEEVPDRPVFNPVLYVKTKTVRAGNLTEVECYPVYQGAYRRKLSKVKPTPEAMKIVNDRNARKRFERLAETNFRTGADYAITLTYAGDAPEDEETCNRDLRNYLKRVNRARKKLGLKRAKAVGVLQVGKLGRLHHHLLIEGGLDRDTMEKLWGKGYANCDRIQAGKGGLTAITRYMTRGFSNKRDIGRHRYFYTRNLKQPVVTMSRTRISRRQAEMIREDANIQGEIIFRKKYPGLKLDSIELKQTDWMPGCYIYARMRRD